MVTMILYLEWVDWHFILIYILSLELSSNRLLNIDEPVSSLPRVAAFRFLNHVSFGHFGDSDVIVFSPLFLVSIIYESVIMSWSSISIMNTYSMKLVNFLLHIFDCISSFNLILESFDLLFHLSYLPRHLCAESLQETQGILSLLLVDITYLVVEWMPTLKILMLSSILFPIITNMSVRSLIL